VVRGAREKGIRWFGTEVVDESPVDPVVVDSVFDLVVDCAPGGPPDAIDELRSVPLSDAVASLFASLAADDVLAGASASTSPASWRFLNVEEDFDGRGDAFSRRLPSLPFRARLRGGDTILI
jgi:hypothetical protein